MDITKNAWALRRSEQENDQVRVTVIHVSPVQLCALSIADLFLVAPPVRLSRLHLDEAGRALQVDESSCAS